MDIKILCPLWGSEDLQQEDFLEKVKNAGFDGIETWLPTESKERVRLRQNLQKMDLALVVHQHEAEGQNFKAFKESFLKHLACCAEQSPLLINSHTGRDYFSFSENLELLEISSTFSMDNNIVVAHETHRGRLGYSPADMRGYLQASDQFHVTADFSHWVCVSESMLENFQPELKETIKRSRHVHARIGHEQGPQVSDPFAPEWDYALQKFLSWWDDIVKVNLAMGASYLTFTTEFGPVPYMPVLPYTGMPVANQFMLNCKIKDLLRQRYAKLSN